MSYLGSGAPFAAATRIGLPVGVGAGLVAAVSRARREPSSDGAHQRVRDVHCGVLVHANLDQAMQVAGLIEGVLPDHLP